MIALPDVNVLLALCWAHHPHHDAAHKWFQNAAPNGWATCFATQSGLLRLSLNPAVMQAVVSISTARTVLANLVAHPNHRLINGAPDFTHAEFDVIAARIVGYRQISDAALLYLARKEGLKLASFDRGIESICPWSENLEIISTL